ncbi:bifunctional 5,10-methylenetetrahydrofolate dehydrogenase/5,10-methenyltetrahydrofolate cyclohydrolase [Candidatus Bipolaricaulota bacterium]|nr:bifunctional 5,10-methylenetetrahydrofolate dehydrogenase/5,10-methenyltetrahydrofolate cyclohydrolase [Candidatus Bipolaricaulota bacterium]
MERVALLRNRGIIPHLSVILPTCDEAARAYFRVKARTATQLGIEVESITLEAPSTADIVSHIKSWAHDSTVSGIMIEAPVPPGIDMQAVRNALPAAKDVDGAGIESLGRLLSGKPAFPPATAVAALALAETVGEVAGKHAVVIGRSLVVGRPLALLLLARDATVTVCHSKTRNLSEIARRADILFVAVGRAGFVTGEMVAPGAIVIDIGTNAVDGKLVGDVDASTVEPVAGALSPVPGGVGPLTTTLLLEHVVQAAERTIG